MHPQIGISSRVFWGKQHDLPYIINHVAKHAKIIEIWTEFYKAQSFEVIFDPQKMRQIEESLAGTDLIAMIHAPFHEVNLASPNNKVRALALDEMTRTIEFAPRIDAKIVTIHSGRRVTGFERKKSIMLLIEELNKLGKIARDNGVTLCMENMAAFDPGGGFGHSLCIWPEELLFVFERLKEPIKMTLDTAHLETVPHVNYEEYIYTLKNWIAHTHNADIREKAHIHLPIGSGTVRWNEAFTHMAKIGYKGYFVIEGFINVYQDQFLDLEVKNLADLLKKHFKALE